MIKFIEWNLTILVGTAIGIAIILAILYFIGETVEVFI
jgi:hypothetical protein